MLLPIVNIKGMENCLEDKLSEISELVQIVKWPSDEFIEAWKLVTGKIISLKSMVILQLLENDMSIENKVPEELLDFKNKFHQLYLQIKAVIEYKTCTTREQRFFFNLVNDWQKAKELFPKLWIRYTTEIRDDLRKSCEKQAVVDGILLQGTKLNNHALVNLALILKANVDIRSEPGKETPLLIAARNGYPNIVLLLINAGASIEDQIEGSTCLIRAAFMGRKEIVQMLLNAGANVNARSKYGSTSLMFAVETWDKEIVSILLQSGADVNAKNNFGHTALIWAVSIIGNRSIDILDMLIKSGAYINIQDKNGETALHMAATSFSEESVEMLINAGVDISIANKHGQTALMKAKKYGSTENIVKLLEEADNKISPQAKPEKSRCCLS